MNRPAARWAAVTVWAGLIFFLSSQSHLPGPEVVFIDKVEHAFVYGVLAFLLARAWLPRLGHLPPRVRWALIVLATALYGVSDEMHQAFVPNRSADPFDALADLTGGALGALGYWLAVRRREVWTPGLR